MAVEASIYAIFLLFSLVSFWKRLRFLSYVLQLFSVISIFLFFLFIYGIAVLDMRVGIRPEVSHAKLPDDTYNLAFWSDVLHGVALAVMGFSILFILIKKAQEQRGKG